MLGLVFFIIAALVPLGLGAVLAKRFAGWTRWRTIIIAASPIPATVAIFVLVLVIASMADSSPNENVGLAMLSAVPGFAAALVLYGLGLGPAAIGVLLARRDQVRLGTGIDEIFE